MNHRSPQLASAMMMALAALFASGNAEAEQTSRVAVTPFAGPGDLARQAHAAVVGIIADRHEIVPSTDILRASAESGGDVREVASAMSVARLTGADAVVIGRVAESGDGFKLALAVRHARSGRSVGAVLVPLFSPVLVTGDQERIRPLILDLLDQVDPAPVELDADRQIEDETPVMLAPKAASPRAELPVRLAGSVGLMVTSRSLRFREEPGTSSGASLDSAPTAGLVLDAEATSQGPHRGGVAVHLDRAIGARIAFGAPGEALALPVTQQRWSVAAIGRTTWRRFELTGRAGYNGYQYSVAVRPDGLKTPDASYGALEAGLGLGLALPRGVKLHARASVLHVVRSSGITDMAHFGSARARGSDLDGGLSVAVHERARLAFGLRHSRVGLRFNGDGLQASELDDDAGQDVSAATDAVFGAYGQLSFEL